MSRGPSDAPGKSRAGGGPGIRAIEWKIAWRHLRRGGREETPAWVWISLLGAIYLTLVGVGFLLYAAAGIDAAAGEQIFSAAELTPSQRWFGVFGAGALFAGVLWLIVSVLARFFNLLATIITVSVLVGCMALVVVLSLMTGLEEDLRDKILNQRAHVLVSAKDGNRFADYDAVVEALSAAPGVVGASPFVQGEVMAKSGMNRQGGMLLGVQPERIVAVSNLEEIVRRGRFEALADPSRIEDEDPFADDEGTPWRLRHLEGEQLPDATPLARPRARAIGIPLGLMLLALLVGLRRLPWRQWVAPTAAVVLTALAIVGLAPSPEGGPAPIAEAPKAQADPMLERLKPKPLPDAKDLPSPAAAPKADTKSAKSAAAPKRAGAGLIRDAEGFGPPKAGDAKSPVPAGLPEPRDFRIPPVDLSPTPGPEDEGDDWEDPIEELGLSEPELERAPEPSLRALPRPPAPSADDEEGWEDPVEALDLPPERPKAAEGPKPAAAPEVGGGSPKGTRASGGRGGKGVADAILIGNELSKELAVRVGSRVQLITPIGRMTPAGRVPGLLATRVGGIFYSGNYEFDRKNIYAPLPVVQRFLRTGDRVSGIEIKLEDPDALTAGKAAVETVLSDLGREAELHAETWQDLNKNLFSAMLLEKIAMGVALLAVVLVASFGILASNLMSVLEKAKEIAILKAMGAPDVQIQRVFVAEGLCLGLIGATGGLLVGLGLCWGLERFGFPFDENVYYIEKLPVVVNPLEVAIVGVAALLIIWASSLYPARVASRMRPVDGLRENDR